MANKTQVWHLSFQPNDMTSYWELVEINDTITISDNGVDTNGGPTVMAVISDIVSIQDGATGMESLIEWINIQDSISARVRGVHETINISDPRFYDYE